MENRPENREMAQAVLDYIHKYPEKHNQTNFFSSNDVDHCGTTMCIAGTAAFLQYGSEVNEILNDSDQDVPVVAAELLGLSYPESEVVFYEMDNERAIQKLKKIVVGEPFTKEDFRIAANPNQYMGLSLDIESWEDYCKENNLTDE